MENWILKQMTKENAAEIVRWKYEKPYDIYNWENEDDPGELLNGSYYAVYRKEEQGEKLWAFVCYGFDAQINPKVGRAAVYTPGYTDIGLGMAPEHCGKGYGSSFLKAALSFGRQLGYGPFRLTVAQFNQRAAQVYRKLGFCEQQTVEQNGTGIPFLVMTLKEQGE